MDLNQPDQQELVALLSPHMRKITQVIHDLHELNNRWGTLSAIAEVTCEGQNDIVETMTKTRRAFASSEAKLNGQLLKEELNKVVERLGSYAQVTADIIVRNLYERTADVGFLATDADIREFLSRGGGPEARERIVERLKEYRNKYTVYDEVIILGNNGAVLARLKECPDRTLSEPWLDQTLAQRGFVETFGKTALCPDKDRALLYSQRITSPDGNSVLGALALSFDFEGEMRGVFRDLRKAHDTSVTLLLDPEGRVIASSDEDHIPVGRRMSIIAEDEPFGIVTSAGQEYIAVTKRGRAYEGYKGPGWHGHDMVPISRAFRDNSSRVLAGIAPAFLEKVLLHADALCPELTAIVSGTANINESLRRVVWNGQIKATQNQDSNNALKAILRIVSATGSLTSDAFNKAITELHGTVISSNLRTAEGRAALMIDIMDRNLYERADDCRWWALTSDIRRILTEGNLGPESQAEIMKILAYINNLYTVYTRLIVYDTTGTVVAASNFGNDPIDVIGKKLDGAFVPETFAIQTTQQYRVSPFESSWLYGDHPTYIYSAAIRHARNPAKVVGGIGIVFDAAPQFKKMLDDCLPEMPGAFGLFVEKNSARIIASSKDSGHRIGDLLRIDREFFAMPEKSGLSRILLYRGHYYVVGCHASRGYREYKNTGDYANDVLAFVFMPIGKEEAGAKVKTRRSPHPLPAPKSSKEGSKEFGTFYVGEKLYAVRASAVCDSMEASRIEITPGSKPYVAGVVPFRENHKIPLSVPVISGRYLFECEKPVETVRNPSGQVIILQTKIGEVLGFIGLLVDELDSVIIVPESQISEISHLVQQHDGGFVLETLLLQNGKGDMDIINVINPAVILTVARRI